MNPRATFAAMIYRLDVYVGQLVQKLKEKGKFYTVLSLDQGTNTGAIKIRLRTLLAEIEERNSFCKER